MKKHDALPVYGLTPFTMLDYPDHTACIIWFAGCNMRCGYCHNPDIVQGGKGIIPMADIFSFLEKRQGLLNGVVLSGGEATLYPDIEQVAQTIKNMGFAIKLDTNGTRPTVVQKLVKHNLVDYIALDYKAPKEKMKRVTGIDHYQKFDTTLNYLCSQKTVPFEIRTTVHTALLDEKDLIQIMCHLKKAGYTGAYHVQNYRHTDTLSNMHEQTRLLEMDKEDDKEWPFQVTYRNFPA
jgi:pyruvate formate lyase activating enzyme